MQLAGSFTTLPRPKVELSLKRLLAMAAGVAVIVAIVALAGHPMQTASRALTRAASANPWLLAAAVASEVASFAGYTALTSLVLGAATEHLTAGVSARLTLAGTAVNRLLPTAGLGGIGLTVWTLRRAGLSKKCASLVLLTFLVVLYTVFLCGLVVAGALALSGGAGDAPPWTGVVPIAFGLTSLSVGAAIALRGPATGRAGTLSAGIRRALTVVRSGDPRLAGALAWWAFDLAVLATVFAALGDAPSAGVIVLAYFAGTVANTIPMPGAVASGMTGILLLCGVSADLALPAVLCYRAVSLWIPIPIGAGALVKLGRETARWA